MLILYEINAKSRLGGSLCYVDSKFYHKLK